MSKSVTATELGRNLAEYLNRVNYRGESFIVQRAGRPIAELRPHAGGVTGKDILERIRSGPRLTPDEAEAFGEDIERARAEVGPARVADPWDS